MSSRYEQVKGFWDKGLWSESKVRNAVGKNWITPEEFEQITGKKFN